jgi:hypothetical protein
MTMQQVRARLLEFISRLQEGKIEFTILACEIEDFWTDVFKAYRFRLLEPGDAVPKVGDAISPGLIRPHLDNVIEALLLRDRTTATNHAIRTLLSLHES